MTLEIDIPADISSALEKRWQNVSRQALEGLAIKAYREGVLTRSQARRLLGFETATELDAFMSQAGVPFPYAVEDFEADIKTLDNLGIR
jgi:predicted HTH domain antitoxin